MALYTIEINPANCIELSQPEHDMLNHTIISVMHEPLSIAAPDFINRVQKARDFAKEQIEKHDAIYGAQFRYMFYRVFAGSDSADVFTARRHGEEYIIYYTGVKKMAHW